MAEEAQDRFIRPIVNASFPGIQAALSLTVFGIIDIRATPPLLIRVAILLGAIASLMSSFFVFFYGIYPTRKKLWSAAALSFLVGIFASIAAVILLMIIPPDTWTT